MSYSDITLCDPSRLKRFVQNKRFADAVSIIGREQPASNIVDFGAGNAELAVRLSRIRPASTIICYEPGELIHEAEKMIDRIPSIKLTNDISSIPSGWADAVCCLEVFEHLPDRETLDALHEIHRVMKKGAWAIIGVPVEIGPVAVAKGIFRIGRRSDFDTRIANIWKAFLGMKFKNRPKVKIISGSEYHPHHTGFDYRVLREKLHRHFSFSYQQTSPARFISPLFNSEIYLVVRKKAGAYRDF